ncbi:hypothetical protein [Thalassotalea agarivorans]|uniref:Uncharacterized protein n=1 Tax=Thalassotalea agarivorans TaxID=349064 RepID=A0A1I0AX49_THASX|nr:hypothetical protein [Thalassotalea agarivorans]SES98802.1 hypothetical protein SAMN05660429_00843 [Thalassotalea agarivorans]
MDENTALEDIKKGLYAALTLFILSCFMFFIGVISAPSDALASFQDTWYLVDIVLLGLLTLAVYKKSFLGFVALLIYVIVGKIIVFLDTGQLKGIIVTLIIIHFLIQGARGAKYYHNNKRQLDASYKPQKRWGLIAAIPTFLLLTLSAAITFLEQSNYLVDQSIKKGAEVSDSQYKSLLDEQVINLGDQIKYFNAHGVLSNLEGGNIITQDSIILYDEEDVYSLYLDDIVALEFMETSDSDYTVYKVVGKGDDYWLTLVVPANDKMKGEVLGMLRRTIKQNNAPNS